MFCPRTPWGEYLLRQFGLQLEKWFQREYPNEKLADVSKYTRQALRKAGVDDRRINELWRSGALRGVETQQVLAKAGLWEMRQARASSLANKRVPPVSPFAPGVVPVARGSKDEESISRLERQLEKQIEQLASTERWKLTQWVSNVLTPAPADTFNKSGKDKIRNVDIGPAEGVIKNPYNPKNFTDAIDTSGKKDDGHNGGFSGPIRPSKGRPQSK